MKRFIMDGYVCGEIKDGRTASGKQVTNFSVNSPSHRKDPQTGECENVPHFFNCQYWHRNDSDFKAGFIADKEHLMLTGEPRYETWEDASGAKRSRVVFNVSDIFQIARRRDECPSPRETAATASLYDSDIPF